VYRPENISNMLFISQTEWVYSL